MNEGDVQSHYSDAQGYRMPGVYPQAMAQYIQPHYGHSVDDYGQSLRGRVTLNRPVGPNVGRDDSLFDQIPADNEVFATFVQPNAVQDEDFSTDYEETCSQLLEHLITHEFQVCDSPEQKKHKEQVLFKLNEILQRWMQKVRERHGKRPDDTNSNAVLLCIGSYKLGVSSPSGDIDTVILAHSFVDRNDDFFGILYPLLLEMSQTDPNVKDVTKVNQEHTVTPLIQMTFHGIPIDMQFATLYQNQQTENLKDFIENKVDNNDCMKEMDEKMKRSYNGYRNAIMIPRSMKRTNDSEMMNQKRELVFRTTLRIIKLWAKNNQLDSNKLGYLGGLSWAILTAKVCKLYPYKCTAKLLERFFHIFGYQWKWGAGEYVVRIVNQSPGESKSLGRAMYVMTPASPQMNSTYNAISSTREIIVTRMREAHSLVSSLLNKRSPPLKNEWLQLFNKFDFFAHYEHFIEINILAGPGADHLSWHGFVEAKVRRLVENYEDLQRFYDLKIHPWPQCYERDSRIFPGYPHAETLYIGLVLGQSYEESIDLTLPLVRFIDFLEGDWNKENKLRKSEEYNIAVSYRTKEEIPPDIWPADPNAKDKIPLSKANSHLSEAHLEVPDGNDPLNPETPKSQALSQRVGLWPSGPDDDEGNGVRDIPTELVLQARKSTLKEDIREAEDEAEMEPLQGEIFEFHETFPNQQMSPGSGLLKPKFIPKTIEELYAQFDDYWNGSDIAPPVEYLSKRVALHDLDAIDEGRNGGSNPELQDSSSYHHGPMNHLNGYGSTSNSSGYRPAGQHSDPIISTAKITINSPNSGQMTPGHNSNLIQATMDGTQTFDKQSLLDQSSTNHTLITKQEVAYN